MAFVPTPSSAGGVPYAGVALPRSRATATCPPNPCATVSEARTRAYKAVDRLDWPQGFCRRDIAWRAVARGL